MKDHQLLITDDGSHTLISNQYDDTYHSKHGAIQESRHVFIEHGLAYVANQGRDDKKLEILELGFGTGLNAALSLLFTKKSAKIHISYVSLEAHPISPDIVKEINYPKFLDLPEFYELHHCAWNVKHALAKRFDFEKRHQFFENLSDENLYDLVYYDPFSPDCQPELWNNEMTEKVALSMKRNACLVSYCAKGSFRRNLQAWGLSIERLTGPPGKREMIRATKA